MAQGNHCLFCGNETGPNPYLGDTNPDHVCHIADPEAPSLEILYAEGREYDPFCSKEHYVRWLKDARHRIECREREEPEGDCPDTGL